MFFISKAAFDGFGGSIVTGILDAASSILYD